MNSISRTDQIEGMAKEICAMLEPIMVNWLKTATTSCLNCVHFRNAKEECGLVNVRPPARVIAFGCPKFEESGVPF